MACPLPATAAIPPNNCKRKLSTPDDLLASYGSVLFSNKIGCSPMHYRLETFWKRYPDRLAKCRDLSICRKVTLLCTQGRNQANRVSAVLTYCACGAQTLRNHGVPVSGKFLMEPSCILQRLKRCFSSYTSKCPCLQGGMCQTHQEETMYKPSQWNRLFIFISLTLMLILAVLGPGRSQTAIAGPAVSAPDLAAIWQLAQQ